MRFSLRTRVLAATLVLVALGLAVAGFATYSLLRKSLIDRLDDQLLAARGPVMFELSHVESGPGPDGHGPGGEVPLGSYAALYSADGNLLRQQWFTYGGADGDEARPVVPDELIREAALPGGADPPPRSVDSDGEGPGYRLGVYGVVFNENDAHGAVAIALPLAEMNQTLHRLVLVEVGVALVVLLAIGFLSWWLVRLGLRPLDRMATTAGAIAAGDLSKRVEPEDDRTEVGRLGSSLNAMLGQIETSFEEQRASEARLRRFVADASHELRTPLTSIRGYAELFRRGAADRPEDLERAMRRIEDEGARMGVLVDDLLLLARLDQGRPLEQQPVDLSALVGDATDDLRAADPERAVTVEATGGIWVRGDEPRLRQVVANLLDNARTHTPAGTAVEVRLARVDGHAVLEVADRGPGMTEEEAARVFERFFRGDPSRSRASGGTGLGLSIAASIVQAHGGAIDVSAVHGEGATFRISLPVFEPAAGDEPEPEDPATDEAAAASEPATERA
jgi:two-component system OmpR family sensor kinase